MEKLLSKLETLSKWLKGIAITLLFVFLSSATFAQSKYNAPLLDTLQQIAATNSPAKHFAKLYYEAIEATNKYAANKPDSVKQFIFGFESAFAPEFFQSNRNFKKDKRNVFQASFTSTSSCFSVRRTI